MDWEKRKSLQEFWDRELKNNTCFTDYGELKSIYILNEDLAEGEFINGAVFTINLEFINKRNN